MNDIQLTKNEDLIYASFKLLRNGLIAIGQPTFEQWEEVGRFIKKAEGSVHFWIGDWLNYGKFRYGEKYTQAIDETSYDVQTLMNDAWVAGRIETSRRRENVPWGIHAEVASFKPEEQDKLLEKAERLGLTVKQLRKEKHRLAIEEKRPPETLDDKLILGDAVTELLTIPDQSIDCVVTDPPYGIDYQSNRREVKEQHDKIQGDTDEAWVVLDSVCETLKQKMKPNSHLYFFTSWKVFSKFEAIIGKYFDIANVLVWDKMNHGTGDLEGNYGEQYELIIFATTGRRILNGDRPSNIIPFSRTTDTSHPTEKPVGLIEKLIEVSTQEGECVMDPFMGSGSTCIAAKNLKRNYWGIEIDGQWYNEAQRRING